MNKTAKWIVGAVVVLVVIVWGYSASVQNKSVSSEPIKIGVITPLTGDAAIYGQSAKNGIDLAVENINKQGGVLGRKISVVYEDTHLDSNTAVTAINKYINIDNISFIITAEGSGATLAVTPLADKNKTLMVIPIASAASIKDAGDYVFRVMPSDGYRGTEMAKLANQLGDKKIAVLYVNDAYGVGIKDSLEEKFVGTDRQIVVVESFESNAKDFRTQLTKIKSAGPDIIMIEARKEFPIILKEIKEMGIRSQIVASEMLDKSLLSEAGDASEGMLAIDFAPTTDFANYKVDYKNKYGTDPSIYGDYSYDSLMVLAKAIESANSTDTSKVKNALYKTAYNGATDLVKFDFNGEVTEKSFVIYKVKNGQFVPYNI